YEKRTKAHPILMSLSSGNVTVNEETVDDALVAVELLRNHARIRPDGVFILGHSLGGMLIPRIAQGNEAIAGFISLAGSARPLEDLALDQTRYILSLDGELTEEDNARIEKLEAQVARVKSLDLSLSTPPEDFPLGVPASYWIDLRGYDPAKEIKAVQRPILVLHGERDYQVTTEDFERWRMALAGRDNARLISYPELNHLFIAGSGKSTPQEYSAPGNVAAVVIEDIAEWIAGNMRAALPESTKQSANPTE
ncbi:MAG: alpha/beta fold hydrolase, partial [Bryobacteraceae bacterium]|nr:alpha/beta fold hydrolase [Bryobacteraceae bacterium]